MSSVCSLICTPSIKDTRRFSQIVSTFELVESGIDFHGVMSLFIFFSVADIGQHFNADYLFNVNCFLYCVNPFNDEFSFVVHENTTSIFLILSLNDIFTGGDYSLFAIYSIEHIPSYTNRVTVLRSKTTCGLIGSFITNFFTCEARNDAIERTVYMIVLAVQRTGKASVDGKSDCS